MTPMSEQQCRGCKGGKIICHTPEAALTPGQCRQAWLGNVGPHHGCVLTDMHDGACICRCGATR